MAPQTRAQKREEAETEPAFESGPSTSKDEEPSNVVYIGHIPHGFYEKQMKEYFAQFGRVTKVRLSRNKKSGTSKHYAFLEFYSPEVARIASEAMDGYLFFGRRLSCHLVPRSKVHAELWVGANRRFKDMPWRSLEAKRRKRAEADPEAVTKAAASAVARDRARRKKIAEAGIEYEYEPLSLKGPPKPTKTTFDD